MFEYDEEAKRWVAMHHPFTAPKDGHEDYLATDPAKALAKAYDMVLNGSEIGGGSVRIHREDVQSKVFRALTIGAEEAKLKFGFLLDALQYGAPPHGGIAFGLDRIVAMMAGAESIRDVIAFPKTQRAQCLLTQAPSPVDEKQLRELHIRLRSAEKQPEKLERAALDCGPANMKRLIVVFCALLALSGAAFARGPAPIGDIALAALPREAHATLALIKAGGPFAYAKDGSVFGNRERLLPRAKPRLLPRIHGADAGRARPRRAPHRRRRTGRVLLQRRPLQFFQAHP